MHKIFISGLLFIITLSVIAQEIPGLKNQPRLIDVGDAWARNSVNAVAYRHNALTSYKNTQYIAFYDSEQRVVLGKRKTGFLKWDLHVTQYKGNAKDAHNAISIAVDGDGFLHVSWDHHNNPLRYCRSLKPGSLELSDKMPMTGIRENKVTYPEFYTLPNGNIVFLYRDGGSGNGNLMMNYYDHKKRKWSQVQDGWVNGEGERNAYWQMAIDGKGTIHLVWVWRETGDVETNHDICYARSRDGGVTWEKSTGEKYQGDITAASAEYLYKIPQKSELINPPTITADEKGRVYIATYWREASSAVPQYRLIYYDGSRWAQQQITGRKTPFSLSGSGTKRIPIARPQLMVNAKGGKQRLLLIYRDEERGSKATAAVNDDITSASWRIEDLTSETLGQWEPNYDAELWKSKGILNLFVLRVEQPDAEGLAAFPPQRLRVLEWKPDWNR